MTPAVPGHAEPAAAPGLAVEEEPEPITAATVGPADASGRTAAAVMGVVIITAAGLVVRWVMLAEQMWCTEDDTIAGGVTRCLPVTDTMKTVTNWVFLGGIGLIWVIVAITVLRNLTREQPPAAENRIDEGEQP